MELKILLKLGVSMSTQTLPIQFDCQNEEENEVSTLRNQKISNLGLSRSASYKTNSCQTNSPNNDFYQHNNQQHNNIHNLSNNCATLSTSSFENESNEPTNIYSNNNSAILSRLNIKSTPTTPTPLSIGNNQNGDHHHHHHGNGSNRFTSNQQTARSSVNNQTQSPSYIHSNNSQLAIESQNYYSLARNDDYLISNFRPFNANNPNPNYFRSGQSVTAYMGQASIPSTSNNNARVYNSMNTLSSSSSVNYNNTNNNPNNSFNHLNQRTHMNTINSSSINSSNYSPSNGSSNYNGNVYYRQKDFENGIMQVTDAKNQTSTLRHQTNSYTSPSTPIANSYSRSNTVLNNHSWKITNGILINDKNDFNQNYDDQDHYSNRRDPNG